MWTDGRAPKAIVEAEGLVQVTDASAIEAAAKQVIEANPKQLESYRAGKVQLFGFFVGQTLKATGGKANPEMVNEVLKKLLGGN